MRTTTTGPAARQSAFGGMRVMVKPCARPVVVVRKPAVSPTCGATPKGLPVSVSSYDDEMKEQSRKFRRTVFTFESWEGHRSSDRYLRHIQGMFTSRVVRGLGRPLTYMVAISSAVVAYETARQAGVLPEELPSIQLNSKEVFGLTSFALSLLLVFRTNASYERWDGARKMWGLVLNRSRDLVRQGLTYIPENQPELRDMIVRWTPAFSKSLMCHLRKDDDYRQAMQDILLPHELDALLKSTHRPNFALQVLSEIIGQANCGTAGKMRMDDNLTAFEDCLGGCERILKTPIPLSYTRHTSRFLMIWLTMLPFSLVGACGVNTVPITAVIAFLLLGIEEIGVSIEEPFSILALEAISDSALNNTRELQAMHDASKNGEGPTATQLVETERSARQGGDKVLATVSQSASRNGNGHAKSTPRPATAGLLSFRN